MNVPVTTCMWVLALALVSGCKFIPGTTVEPVAEETKPLITYIDNLELAKIILSPPPKELKVTRDPFKPLFEGQFVGDVSETGDLAADITYVGVIRIDNEFIAYLQTPGKKGAYKVKDKVGAFTIERIDMDKIVLKSGDNEVIKKRGKT